MYLISNQNLYVMLSKGKFSKSPSGIQSILSNYNSYGNIFGEHFHIQIDYQTVKMNFEKIIEIQYFLLNLMGIPTNPSKIKLNKFLKVLFSLNCSIMLLFIVFETQFCVNNLDKTEKVLDNLSYTFSAICSTFKALQLYLNIDSYIRVVEDVKELNSRGSGG